MTEEFAPNIKTIGESDRRLAYDLMTKTEDANVRAVCKILLDLNASNVHARQELEKLKERLARGRT